jgi:acetyltransferase-like isoleucine patch superfamily enzyme
MDLKISDLRKFASHGDGRLRLKDLKRVGENVVFEEGVLVFNPENISIGENVYVGHNTILKGYHKNEMVIGDHTWVGQCCFFHSAGGIRIGRAVGFGPGVKILTSVHKDEVPSRPVILNELEFAETVIRDGCDIGIGAIILPGVEIGEGSIVGAGSVVTKDIGPFSVVAGNPARVLRTRK